MAITLDEVVEFAVRQIVGVQSLQGRIVALAEENTTLKAELAKLKEAESAEAT